MRMLTFAILLGLLAAGCIQPPPPSVNNSTSIPPGYEVKDYCQKDEDCVRLNSCCDCGLGGYVNRYNQQPECPLGEPRCMCPIALSKGLCLNNECVAAPENTTSIDVTFKSEQGRCGGEAAPERVDGDGWVFLNGSMQGAYPCFAISADFEKSDDGYVLDLTTKAIPGVDNCIACVGAVPWAANITGYSGSISVRYDGREVFPAKSGFCGWSTNGTCSGDGDCVSGGCSGQVCQGASEEPVITTCEYRECYDAQAYGISCGCVSGSCGWQ